jgi:hypothetical protein
MAAWFLLRIVIVDNSDVFPQSDLFARLWRKVASEWQAQLLQECDVARIATQIL